MVGIFAVMWKEWREIFSQRGIGKFGLVFFLIFFGILFPWQHGADWSRDPSLLAIGIFASFLQISSIIADSIAGERERHTLETLLASRLSDEAILFGKIAVALIYGLCLSIGIIFLGMITTSIVYGINKVRFIAPQAFIAVVVIYLLGAGLITGAGILISLHSSSVRQATQTLSILILSILWAPVLIFLMLPQSLQLLLKKNFSLLQGDYLLIWVPVLLFAIDVFILWTAKNQFKRSRLLLIK